MSSDQPDEAGAAARGRRRVSRVPVGMAALAAFIGLSSFFSVAGNARFEAYHTLDVIRLMTAGAGLGVALVVLIQFFNFPDPRPNDRAA